MKAKKKLLLALCIVVVLTATVAGSVLGTIAYMTSASKVSNVFTIGNVRITLDESLVDSNGLIPEGSTTRTDRTKGSSSSRSSSRSINTPPDLYFV